MLEKLRRWWGGYLASIPKSDVVDSIPESQWGRADLLPPVSKVKRQAFTELLELIHAHRPPAEAQASVAAGVPAFTRADEPDSALIAALFPDDGRESAAARGFILCDWKDAREVQWQADALCVAHGLPLGWQAPEGSLPSVLSSFAVWLQGHGRELLCLAEGDATVAFALSPPQAIAARALCKRLRLVLRRADET